MRNHPSVPKTPFVLLGLMTVLTVAGPILISQSMKGGATPRWPPDRPVEWWVFSIVSGAVLLLMLACLGIGLTNWRKTLAQQSARRNEAEPRPAPVDDSFNSD